MAHGADLLETIARNECIGKMEMLAILEVLKEKICIGNYVYIDNEPWRMSRVVISIIKRKE